MNGINLIPQRRRDARRRRRHVRWCVAGCAAYALAAAAGAAALYSWGPEDRGVKQQLARVQQDIQRREHALSASRTRLAATRTTLEIDHQIIDRPDWSRLLALLARESGGQVVLRSCQLHLRPARTNDAAGTFLLTAAGASHTPADAQAYAMRLQDSGMFDRVTLLDTRREPFLDVQASSFRLECEMGVTLPAAAPAGQKEQR